MSGDPEQEFFADGIVEDLISALSHFRWLFVIARNSSFTYKGKSANVKQISSDLGVRYVVEGSVRRSGTRLRVTVQLIDAANDHNVWADNFDRPVGDLFDLQDEITQAITGLMVPALGSAERERSLRDNRPSLDAWEAYQKGLAFYYRPYSYDDHAQARRLFDQAIELDPNFSDAHAMVAFMGIYAVNSGRSSYTASTEDILSEAARAAERAVQIEDNNALAHTALGRVRGLLGDEEIGIAECKTAVRLNPNLAIAHHELGFIFVYSGQLEEAAPCFDKAIQLSPNDPSRWNFYHLKGICLYQMEKYEEAGDNFRQAVVLRSTVAAPHIWLAAIFVERGQMMEARAAVKDTLARNPYVTLALVSRLCSFLPDNVLTIFLDRLREAGLPEE